MAQAAANPTLPGARPGYGTSEELYALRQSCDNRLLGLRTDRYSWWVHWRELADYILPRRYKWLITPNQLTRGSPINQRIIDSTGTISARVLAAGMMAGITSPGRPWVRLTLDDKELADTAPVRRWLDEVRDRMLIVFAESNYYTAKHTEYQDLGCFGTAAKIIYEDYEDVIRCYSSALGEYYLGNGPRLNVDTFYREFPMTCYQVAAFFGLENASPTVKAAMQTKGAELVREVVIAHAIEPNNNLLPGAPGTRGMPWREVYWEYGSGNNEVLAIRGFHECPFTAARWDTVSNDAYGRSPGMDALGDVKQLQVEQKRKAQAIDKMVNPPLKADPSLKNEPASVIPGGVTYVANAGAAGTGFSPVYQVKPDIAGLTADIQECQGRIKEVFFYNLFLMISQLDTVRTATEIDARREEKLIQLGPVLERFENESLDPDITRVYHIMDRARLLPQMPAEMKGHMVRPEYVSMLAQAQRAAMTAGMERFVAFVGNLAAQQPAAADNLDIDETINEYAEMLGVPSKIVASLAEVAKIRAMRQQQQQQAAQVEASAAAVQGAKVLSETEVGGGQNALQRMIGTA